MKEASRQLAHAWRQKGYGFLLRDTYQLHEKQSDFPNTQTLLNVASRLPDEECCRGMERKCSKQHGEERWFLKRRAIRTVLRHQQRLLLLKKEEETSLTMEEVWMELSKTSAVQTQCARIFARRMGIADAVAVRDPWTPREAYRNLEELHLIQKANKRRGGGGGGSQTTTTRMRPSVLRHPPGCRSRFSSSSPSLFVEHLHAAGVA